MYETTIAELMRKERERLMSLRHDAENRKATIDAEIAEIDKELKAIDAYETIKHGKAAKARTGIRAEVLQYLREHPEGSERNDLLIALQAKGDRTRERSITNALSALKRAGKIIANDGRYTAT